MEEFVVSFKIAQLLANNAWYESTKYYWAKEGDLWSLNNAKEYPPQTYIDDGGDVYLWAPTFDDLIIRISSNCVVLYRTDHENYVALSEFNVVNVAMPDQQQIRPIDALAVLWVRECASEPF